MDVVLLNSSSFCSGYSISVYTIEIIVAIIIQVLNIRNITYYIYFENHSILFTMYVPKSYLRRL